MKYTLAQNAISSLSIATECFKKLYFKEDTLTESEYCENEKIGLIFLENSIELFLKLILISDQSNPCAIYEHPDSKIIQKALKKVTTETPLEDILIKEGHFHTISYSETVKRYSEKSSSFKVRSILDELGQKRNALTHFGYESENDADIILCFIKTFDVIFNYLYPQLIELDKIGRYFTDDDLFIDTIHGVKPLFGDDFIYNNFVDLFDELLGDDFEYFSSLKAQDETSRIYLFTNIMEELLNDKKFAHMISSYENLEFIASEKDFVNNQFYFEFNINGSELFAVHNCYSLFFNVTYFCGQWGEIYFCIVHDKNDIYIYNDNPVIKTNYDEPEKEYHWKDDEKNGLCKRYNLSKRHLLSAFQSMININIIEEESDNV